MEIANVVELIVSFCLGYLACFVLVRTNVIR